MMPATSSTIAGNSSVKDRPASGTLTLFAGKAFRKYRFSLGCAS